MRSITFAALASAVLLWAPLSSAKDFDPGDVRACNADDCVPLVGRRVLRELSSFIYGDERVVRVATLRRGAPILELRYRNGYVPGLVGGSRLDRFRSHGVFCGRFRRGIWYRVPPELARDLRRATRHLTRLPFSSSAPRSC
jgi:hypothetical protein